MFILPAQCGLTPRAIRVHIRIYRHIGTQRQIFFVQLQTAQRRAPSVSPAEIPQQHGGQNIQRHHAFVVANRNHGALTAVGAGGEVKQLMTQEVAERGAGYRVFFCAGSTQPNSSFSRPSSTTLT